MHERLRDHGLARFSQPVMTVPGTMSVTLRMMQSVLSQLGQAFFLVDAQGSVICTNDCGERLLGERDILCLHSGRLSAPDAEQRSRLLAFIGHRNPTEAGHAPDSLVLSGRCDRFVTLRSLSTVVWAELSPEVSRLRVLVARDPQALGTGARRRAWAAKSAFGWTPREAELSEHLLLGKSLAEAAQAMGITTDYARQRLKAIFAKAGVGSQGQLIALMATFD